MTTLRLEEQMVTVHPLTPDRWGDFEKLFRRGGPQNMCWCMWWRVPSKEMDGRTREQNRTDFRAIVEAGRAPGLLAYDGDEAAGWIAIAPRSEVGARFTPRARVYRVLDDVPVWSVTCFYTRRERRGQGVSAALLDAAVGYAFAHGAPMIEAYPIIPADDAPVSEFSAFTGTLPLFLKAGFVEAARPTPTRAIVRKAP